MMLDTALFITWALKGLPIQQTENVDMTQRHFAKQYKTKQQIQNMKCVSRLTRALMEINP